MTKKTLMLFCFLVLASGCSNDLTNSEIYKVPKEEIIEHSNTDTTIMHNKPKLTEEQIQQSQHNQKQVPVNDSINSPSDEIVSNITPEIEEKNEDEIHQHTWNPIFKPLHHDEVSHYEKVMVKDAFDEKVPIYEKVFVMICNECDYVMRNAEELDAHFRGNFDCGSWRDATIIEQTGTEVIHHDAIYEENYIVDKEAWDEQVIDYYSCSCGQTKH